MASRKDVAARGVKATSKTGSVSSCARATCSHESPMVLEVTSPGFGFRLAGLFASRVVT